MKAPGQILINVHRYLRLSKGINFFIFFNTFLFLTTLKILVQFDQYHNLCHLNHFETNFSSWLATDSICKSVICKVNSDKSYKLGIIIVPRKNPRILHNSESLRETY